MAGGHRQAAVAEVPVVGIGASAGGMQALQTLFEALPDQTPPSSSSCISPDHRSELAGILGAHHDAGDARMATRSRSSPTGST